MVLLKNSNERNNFAEAIVEALYLDPCNVGTLWEVIAEENYCQTGMVLSYIGEDALICLLVVANIALSCRRPLGRFRDMPE